MTAEQVLVEGSVGSVVRQTSVEQASDALQRAICSGELEPGHKMVLAELARALGMSITPVREALRQLQREGLVVDSPYSGMRVSSLSAAELTDLFCVRGLLDGLATARGLARVGSAELEEAGALVREMDAAAGEGDAATFMDLNDRFHAIFIAPGAPAGGALATIMDHVRLHTGRYSAAARHALPSDALRASNAEHEQILVHARAGDTDRLEALCRVHASSFSQNLASALGFDHAG